MAVACNQTAAEARCAPPEVDAPGTAPPDAVAAEVVVNAAAGGVALVVDAVLPYRQHDPKWGSDLMWDRSLVIKAATQLNGESKSDAESLLRAFDDGNNIANEGCLLSCLAMVLRLLAPQPKIWTPKNLNVAAHEAYYYTLCGLSMTTLYADLVSEVTDGQVQLCLKEEYLSGQPGWPKKFARNSALLRAYRSLIPSQRAAFALMLKTGTYDDTVASHYVLLHPAENGDLDADDLLILDPAKPLAETKPWHLTDSASTILEDPEIAAGWKQAAVEPAQLGGVWVFTKWRADRDRSLLGPLVSAWAAQL